MVREQRGTSGPHKWFGRTQTYPFTATVTAEGAPTPILLNGTRRQVPRFPWWIPTAALALVGILIAVIALWPKPKVPVVGGVDRLAATTQLEDAGYRAQPIEQPDDAVAQGLVIGTEPAGGQPLSRGERVQMFVSVGPCVDPCPIEVPNVVRLTFAQAEQDLTAAQFTVRRVDSPSADVPADEVISSDPPGGTERPLGSEVVVEVSTGPVPAPTSEAGPAPGPIPVPSVDPGGSFELPDVVGQLAMKATTALEDLGLTVEQSPVRSNQAPADTVLTSAPAAGTKVKAGSKVELTVAKPTGRVDLIKLAEENPPRTKWTRSGLNGLLPFPDEKEDPAGYALIREDTENGNTEKVLVTHPPPEADRFISGEFVLNEPILAGDHLRATVSLEGEAEGGVAFMVKAKDKELDPVFRPPEVGCGL